MPRGGPVYRHEVVAAPTASDSLTASARVYGQGPGAQKLRRVGERSRSRAWQSDVWDYYDTVPEFRAACSWVGSQLSKAKLQVHYKGKPTTNQVALDALASLFGGPEGQEEMLRLLGINFTVAGEAFVVGQPGAEDDDWMVAASTEVTEESDQIKVEGETVSPKTLAIRIWKAHPRRSTESDCPARALMPVLGESVRLTQVVASMADSRLKGNGILFVPSEIELPAVPVVTIDDDGDETMSMQDMSISASVTQRLIQVASIALRDRDSAAAGVPLVIAAPGEYLEKVQWIDFWTGFDEHVQKLRDEVTRRIGVGMDMPPEALTGTGDMNHWGAWQIEEAAIKVHTEPLLGVIVASLTTGYLRPLLEAENIPDPDEYTFVADTSAMRLRPNKSKEALELFDRGEISGHTLLVENGFDPENDAPDEKERIFQFVRRMVEKTSASPDQLSALLEKLNINIPAPENDEVRGAMAMPSLREHPVREIPSTKDTEPVQASARLQAPVAIDGLVLAAEQMVYRALERAGNKLRVKVGRSVGGSAADLYLSVPEMSYSECEHLLEDGWSSLARFSYPGVDATHLGRALNDYALMLLRSQKPLDRGSLARHLLLELSDEAAA